MSKISLCIITGNAEEYIERCLQTFSPIADEICLVRAIGNQTPDRTMELAEKMARLYQIPLKTAEYKNQSGIIGRLLPDKVSVDEQGKLWLFDENTAEHSPYHPPAGVLNYSPETWPHVDNFAAARQMSFDLATHEYCFWCDTDDVLEAGAERIRAHAARGDFVCYLFPYNIFGRGRSLPRERLVRKSACKWVHRVHECLEFNPAPARALQDAEVSVLHLPKTEKTGSHGRNLRILESMTEAELTTGMLFHLNEELLLAGRVDESVAVAHKILARPDLGRPEKMELFINLAHGTQDPVVVEQLLHQAYMADPRRREPLAYLANHMLNWGHPDFALAYVRQMLSIPPPPIEQETWNHRRPHYGWLGEELYAQCLRVNGQIAAGDAVQAAALKKAGGARIALIHATRGRGKQAAVARKVWMDLAAHPEVIEHVFILDADDPASDMLRRFRHLVVSPGGGCVAAWNTGAFHTEAPVLIQMSDDWVPPQLWDELLLERLGDVTQPRVLAVSDGQRTDQLLCMAICTRNYVNQDYFLFHPWFTGVYSDNWFTEEAYRRGAVIEARDVVFHHNHPAFGTAKVDETYARQNAPERYVEGERIIQRLRERNDFSTVPGYCNFWPFYQHLARTAADGDVFCEIGVWLGRSTIFLAQELQRLGKTQCRLFAVDTFRGEAGEVEHEVTVARYGGSIRGEFERNLKRCGVAEMVTILEGDSAAMAAHVPDGTLRAVFVDAAHDYASVTADVAAWTPKLKPGGTMSGHDAQWHEVTQAARDVLGEIQVIGGIWVKEMK